MGMVIEPEPTVFATLEPEFIPARALEITATFAGPPTAEPVTELARSTKNVPMPVFSRSAPRIINHTMKVVHT